MGQSRELGIWQRLAPIIVLFAYVGVLVFPFWRDLDRLPSKRNHDAFQHLSFEYATYDSVRHHGEYPLWNPYFGGGIPWAGYIYNPGLTPISLIYITFGEVVGVKLLILCTLLLGSYGMYAVGKDWLNLNRTSAYMP